MADGAKKKCRDCGAVTYKNTTGAPGESCPERPQVYATHRWELAA